MMRMKRMKSTLLAAVLLASFVSANAANLRKAGPFAVFAERPYADIHYALRDTLRVRYYARDLNFANLAVQQMRALPDTYHDHQWDLEADFFRANFLFNNTLLDDRQFVTELERELVTARKYENHVWVVRIARRLFDYYRIDFNDPNTHRCTLLLEEALADITQDEFPDLHDNLCQLARIYVRYHDYDHAAALYRQAVAAPVQSENERISLLASSNLGAILSYDMNDYDGSDSCYQRILDYDAQSPILEHRDEWLLTSRCAIAANNAKRGNYAQALDSLTALLEILPADKSVTRYNMCLHICDCYTALDRPVEARHYLQCADTVQWEDVDSLTMYLHRYLAESRLAALCGDHQAADAAIDSVSAIQTRIEHINSGNLFRETANAIYRNNLEQYQERLHNTRLQNFFLSVGALIALIALIVILWMYRKKKRAYISLAETNRQLAHTDWTTESPLPIRVATLEGTATDISEASATVAEVDVRTFIETHKVYLNPDYTADQLAHDMGINRTYLSHQINRLAPNFNVLINAYRVRYAQLLLEQNPRLSIDELSSSSGFNNRRTFGSAFRAVTGLTPSDYRQNLASS